MKRKLPIEIDSIIKSSCSMFYRMAIIQTLPNYQSWLAVNMNGFVEANGDAKYGEYCEEYRPSFFQSVFNISEKFQADLSNDSIIDYIISSIDRGIYIILYLDYDKIQCGCNSSGKSWYHETLLYGYDDEKKIIYSPVIIDNTFKEKEVPYEDIKIAYSNSKHYFASRPDYAFSKNQWYHIITEIKPKKIQVPPNVYYEYLNRLKREYNGGLIDKYIFNNDEEPLRQVKMRDEDFVHEKGCFFGLAILPAISTLLRRYAREEEYGSLRCLLIENAVKYLLERLLILREGMYWFVEDRQLKNNPFIEKISINFQELIIIAERNVFLMEKYLIRKNFDIFERIADNIDEYYPIEKEMLNELINVVEQENVALY